MPAWVVVGAQWGDEGKGKVVDLIAEQAELVARYGGGANAGHTLKVGGVKVVTHLLPSGVLHPGVRCVLGAGMVIDPKVLVDELQDCEARGFQVRDRLLVSARAHLTFPFQSAIDRAANAGPRSLGTTGRGIGPTYADKAARLGLRVGEACDLGRHGDALDALVDTWAARARAVGAEAPSREGTRAWLGPLTDELRPLLGDASLAVDTAIREGRRVVLEGAQGTLLDLDHGTYPFVTSSNTVAGGACTGLGIGPTRITEVLGITKAYCTRVGHGPFPTELSGPEGERLREQGEEYGATTGRPRRCGWLDLPALRYAARVNGLTALAVTKLDILAEYPEVPVCVAYTVDGARTEEFPVDALDRAEPVYERWPGWDRSVAEARLEDALPVSVRRYLQGIEKAVGVPVVLASVGAERAATIVRRALF
ncbi:MAG: adenylosuccinate synthase [Deltaproteobacteria bacterium]|nr:adenylosuccinate synthase [Deltaproteobacteria bacterium]